ncbi:MAG: FadR/GntR family transcriptional regulator [Oryzihumus sp.]
MSPDFAPVPRQSVSDGVFHELRDAVLDGRFAPGESLPPERQLAESFAVNRHAVREAVKRLQEAGFVRVVHGGGTQVLDVRRTAGLDLLAHLARAGEEEPRTRLIRDGLEMRRCIGVEAARLAATRADARARQRIVAAAAAYRGHDGTADGTDRAFWAEVVDASDNLAFRLSLNSLVHAIDANPDLMDELLADDRSDRTPHAELAEAIAAGEPDRSAEVAGRILSQAVTALERHTRRVARRRTRSA